MKFYGLIFALLAALSLAQSSSTPYAINTPQGGWDISAGNSVTITWANPQSGQIQIRLTQGNVNEPGAGILLTTVDGSTGSATVTIPADLTMGSWNFAIADSTGKFINFSSQFTVAGATAVSSASASASSTASASSSSSTDSSSTDTTTETSTSTGSSTTSTGTSTRTSTMNSSMTSASASMTSVAANAGNYVHAGGMFAMLAGAIAIF